MKKLKILTFFKISPTYSKHRLFWIQFLTKQPPLFINQFSSMQIEVCMLQYLKQSHTKQVTVDNFYQVLLKFFDGSRIA